MKDTLIMIVLIIIVLGGIIAAVFLTQKKPEQPASPIVIGEQQQSATTSAAVQEQKQEPLSSETTTMKTATIVTNKGTIELELFTEDAPKAAGNFATLAEKGYYDGVIFHRVIEGFMIQGGDPTGTGRGGPGYTFEDELDPSTESYKRGYLRGTLAMANAGPNTNGSQFFIMHQDYPLPHNYTIFGRVTSGMEVVDAIATSETGMGDRPVEEIKMESVTVK